MIKALIWKELLVVLKDPKSRISILLPPILQLFLFSYAATLDVTRAKIGIFNQDRGEKSIELVQRISQARVFEDVEFISSKDAVKKYIDEQKGILVVTIEDSFSKNIDRQAKGTIQLLGDGRKSNSLQIVSGYLEQIVEQFNQETLFPDRNPVKANLMSRNWYNPNLIYYWFNIPSLVAVLSMLTCLVVTTASVSREREMGTFDQLLVSPLTSRSIIIGKIVPGILVGLFQGLLIWSLGSWMFDVPFEGSFVLYFFTLFLFVASVSGIGLFISSLCSNQQQTMLGTFIFMTPSVLLSGFATPIENMPSWLQPFTYLLPLRYALIVSKGICLKAMSWAIAIHHLWPMALICCFNLTLAAKYFRSRIE
jgi:ABC-2 type transport system permease protein